MMILRLNDGFVLILLEKSLIVFTLKVATEYLNIHDQVVRL